MKRNAIALFTLLVLSATQLLAQNMIEKRCHSSFENTRTLTEEMLKSKGFVLFATYDHAMAAQQVGKQLRPTIVFVFGKPALGTTLMQCDQHVAYELPLRLLLRTDDNGQVWLSYRDPLKLIAEYQLNDCKSVLENMSRVLAQLTDELAGAERK